MTDRYADLRAALDSGPTGDSWIWANYGPKTIGVGIAGGPAFLMIRPADMIDRDEMESIVHGLVMSRRHVRALLAERDALRGALEQYADPNNWEKDEFGWRRIWREPGSEAPESYDGSELAFAALAQEGS